MLVDAHAHLVTTDPAYPFAPPSGRVPAAVRDDPMTAERLIASLDATGAAAAVAVQRAHVYGHDNRYVLDSARRHPGRLRAMCVIDAQAPEAPATVAELAAHGAAAIRLTAPGGDRHGGPAGTGWFAGPAARGAWAAAASAGLSLCLHVYRWNRDDVLRALPEVCRAFPGVPVVLDHVASVTADGPQPWSGSELLLALTELEQVHVKVTTLNFAWLRAAGREPAELIAWLVDRFGARRVLWGSDVTQTPGAHADMVALARAGVAGLPERDAAEVLGGTAARLYGLAAA
ncbi:amidohydrolase family protein [Pseudonocardia sp. CA-107938]|uniref:amidohydrolase family protein n=1 Tax=Pseudonocardia sp. CA-107938 TaxID=3240021 RepID=UPI003D8BE7A1